MNMNNIDVNVKAVTTPPDVTVQYKTIILKKRLVDGVNTLTQEMMSATNTKYVIKYDYILGENITVPSGCVLEFDGGSINNAVGNYYSITGTNTDINAELVKIFDTNVNIAGSWNIKEAYPEWFGAVKEDSSVDSRLAIQKCINYFAIVVLSGKYYLNSNDNDNGITMPASSTITSNYPSRLQNINSWNRCGLIVSPTSGIEKVIVVNWATTIEHISINGGRTSDWSTNTNDLTGITNPVNNYVSRVTISDVEVCFCKCGIDAIIYLSNLDRVICTRCIEGFYLHGTVDTSMTSLTLNNCYACENIEFGYKLEKLVYSSLINCACDAFGHTALPSGTTAAYTLIRCEGITIQGCGVEQAYRALYMELCAVVTITGCNFSADYTACNINHENWIYLRVLTSCYLGAYIHIYNTPNNWNEKYIFVSDYRDTAHCVEINCTTSYDNISYEYTGSVANGITGVKHGVKVHSVTNVTTEISTSGNTTINDIIHKNAFVEGFVRKIKVTSTSNANLEISSPNTFEDCFGNQTLIFEGYNSDNSSFYVSVGYMSPTFKNYKKIIFKNLKIVAVDGKTIPFINFADTDVTFENCELRLPSGSAFTISAVNTKVEFINSFIFGEGIRDRTFEITGWCNSSIRTMYSTVDEGIPEGVVIKYSNGKRAKVINSIGCNAPMNMSAADLTALKALTSGLQSYEKEMLEGSIGTVADTHKTYTFTNSNWYNPDGSLA